MCLQRYQFQAKNLTIIELTTSLSELEFPSFSSVSSVLGAADNSRFGKMDVNAGLGGFLFIYKTIWLFTKFYLPKNLIKLFQKLRTLIFYFLKNLNVLETIPERDGEITLKMLVGLALASHQSIYPSPQKIEMLGGSTLSSCPHDPQE